MSDISTHYHHNELTDSLTIERKQDASPIIQEVDEFKRVTDGRGDGVKGYFAGRIPAIIIEQYLKEVGVNFQEFIRDDTHIKRIMNNPDYKRFRVFEGRI